MIFTTAYDEYAINAFRVNAVDYLLKPVSAEELRAALRKYDATRRPAPLPDMNRLLELFVPQHRYNRNILIAFQDKLLPVPVERVSCFYSTKEQSRVFLCNGCSYVYNRTLDAVCDDLDPAQFCRVNKQFVVSKQHIRNIVVWSNSRLLLTLDIETPEPVFISKNRAAEFKRWVMA